MLAVDAQSNQLVRPGTRTTLRLVSVTERGHGVVTLSYASA